MEEDKKFTAVQPEEAPKPKPRRRKAASPQPAADTPPAPTDSARRRRADHEKACRVPQEAAGPKKHKDNKDGKNRKAQDAEGC